MLIRPLPSVVRPLLSELVAPVSQSARWQRDRISAK